MTQVCQPCFGLLLRSWGNPVVCRFSCISFTIKEALIRRSNNQILHRYITQREILLRYNNLLIIDINKLLYAVCLIFIAFQPHFPDQPAGDVFTTGISIIITCICMLF